MQAYYITPVPGEDGPVDPGYGVEGPGMRPPRPAHPIALPPLPGIWPKPGEPSLPIVLPPGVWPPTSNRPEISPPIYFPEEPGKPLPLPPGTIWPPIPPDIGISGKVAILVWVSGVGSRWFIYDPALKPTPK